MIAISGIKKLVLSICLLAGIITAEAQSDSLTLVHTRWETKKIAPGVKLRQHWFNNSLFGSNQHISILQVKLNHRNRLDVVADSKELKTASHFGQAYDALAAVNGTFFDMKNGGSVDYIRVDGKAINTTRTGKNNTRTFHQRSAIVIRNGKLYIQPWDSTSGWEEQLPGEDVMVTGPLLLQDGHRSHLDSITFNTARHPRTAVAVKGKKVWLITVDGRNEKAAGMSLYELASLLKWLNAEEGINLDGGGSTTLWVQGFPEGGVVNHPSDNKAMMQSAAYKPGMDLDNLAADFKKWDHGGERSVANVILLNKKK